MTQDFPTNSPIFAMKSILCSCFTCFLSTCLPWSLSGLCVLSSLLFEFCSLSVLAILLQILFCSTSLKKSILQEKHSIQQLKSESSTRELKAFAKMERKLLSIERRETTLYSVLSSVDLFFLSIQRGNEPLFPLIAIIQYWRETWIK